jgi:hypothetical protein
MIITSRFSASFSPPPPNFKQFPANHPTKREKFKSEISIIISNAQKYLLDIPTSFG